MEEKQLRNLIFLYFDYLKKEKEASIHTQRAYSSDLSAFLTFLSEYTKKDINTICIDEIDKKIIKKYMADLFLKKNSKRTMARKISSLKSFFNFLNQKEIYKKNPFLFISTPKFSENLPSFFTEEQLFSFLNSLPDKTFLDKRNQAIFEIFYSTGMRISELVSLNCEDIDFITNEIKVFGKRKKERIVPVGSYALKAAKKYKLALEIKLQRKLENDDAFFVNNRALRISVRGVSYVLASLLKKFGNKSFASAHSFRHSFATHMLNNGANLRVVQKILGHNSLSSTQKYTHLSIDSIVKAYKKTHPRS